MITMYAIRGFRKSTMKIPVFLTDIEKVGAEYFSSDLAKAKYYPTASEVEEAFGAIRKPSFVHQLEVVEIEVFVLHHDPLKLN